MIKAGARPAGWSGRREPHRAGNNAPPGGAAIRAPARTAPRRMLPRIACSGFSFHDKCCSARRRRRAFPPSAAPAPCGSNRGALWRERACWTVRARWRGNEPAKHIATIHAHGQDSGREGDGQAGSDPPRPIVKIHVYGQGRRQNRAQRQLFLANNRPVCYNVDRWSACPAPLPGCGHPLWRTYPFPPE